MEHLKISVIVPVYNLETELPRCIDSILSQTHRNLEVILVDDGSRDGSRQVMESYITRDPRVRTIIQENVGVTSARLRGVQEATGEWIGFVDGDDEIEPDMYERLLSNALKHQAQISHCGYRMVFSDGRVNYFHNTGALETHDRVTALRELLSGTRIEPGLCNKLFHISLFKCLVMPTDIKINEDLLMNFYLFSAAKTAVYDDWCPYHYIVRSTSVSRAKLNHHKIYDPIRVKQYILEAAGPEILSVAQKAYLSTCISVYNVIISSEQGELDKECRQVRQMIIDRAQWRNLLSRKQKLLCLLIRYCPTLYRPLYRFYAAHILKNPYE